jgi:hypothetical protein
LWVGDKGQGDNIDGVADVDGTVGGDPLVGFEAIAGAKYITPEVLQQVADPDQRVALFAVALQAKGQLEAIAAERVTEGFFVVVVGREAVGAEVEVCDTCGIARVGADAVDGVGAAHSVFYCRAPVPGLGFAV